MRVLLIFLISWCICGACFGQTDSLPRAQDSVYHRPAPTAAQLLLDSVANAENARQQFIADSIAMQYINKGDSLRTNQFVLMMLRDSTYHGYGFLEMPKNKQSVVREGHTRHTRDRGIILIIIGLVTYGALLNRIVSKDILNVMQSFYSQRILAQVSKEDGLISSWAFIGLFVLFGLTFGLFLYQISSYYEIFYRISGIQLFLALSVLIIALFAIKFLILKVIGFIFDIGKVVSEYATTLFLTYFNITFVFLPVTLCFSLLAAKYIQPVLISALVISAVIFIWQYLRSSLNIISTFRFPKLYLFIYLCALEICPILVLIKALNIKT